MAAEEWREIQINSGYSYSNFVRKILKINAEILGRPQISFSQIQTLIIHYPIHSLPPFFFLPFKKKLNLFIYSSPKSNLFIIIIYIYIYIHTLHFDFRYFLQFKSLALILHYIWEFLTIWVFFFLPKFSFSFFALKIFICMIYLLGLIYQIGLRWRRSCWSPVLLPVLWFQQRGSRNQRASLWFKSEFCCKFSHSSQKKKSEFW